MFKRGVGVSVLSEYLKDANKEVEVWLQVETRACYDALDDVLSVPGITCAFLGACTRVPVGLYAAKGG